MMKTATSKMFQSKLLKIIKYLMRMNSETIDQHIFRIVHGARYVSEDEGGVDNTSEWTIAQISNLLRQALHTVPRHFLNLRLTGDKVPRELAASGIEHRNRAENRAVYGA